MTPQELWMLQDATLLELLRAVHLLTLAVLVVPLTQLLLYFIRRKGH